MCAEHPIQLKRFKRCGAVISGACLNRIQPLRHFRMTADYNYREFGADSFETTEHGEEVIGFRGTKQQIDFYGRQMRQTIGRGWSGNKPQAGITLRQVRDQFEAQIFREPDKDYRYLTTSRQHTLHPLFGNLSLAGMFRRIQSKLQMREIGIFFWRELFADFFTARLKDIEQRRPDVQARERGIQPVRT